MDDRQQQPNVAEMLLHGVADHEILEIWLRSIRCEEFLTKFIDSGYDMPTISRTTPQDLTAIGVTEPTKRIKILTEVKKLNLQDGLPNFIPPSLKHWLSLIRLDYYYESLCSQQIDTINKMCQLTWEDFEELGVTRLGHQKRFQLAIERIKQLETDPKGSSQEPIYDTNPSQIVLVASSENLQPSSIYATVTRQPSRVRQPPPPVPIRSNSLFRASSLRSTTLSDHMNSQADPNGLGSKPITEDIYDTNTSQIIRVGSFENQQQLMHRSSIYATLQPSIQPPRVKQPPPPVPIRSNSLYKEDSLKQQMSLQQQQQQPHQQQQLWCNATTGKDEAFPPPPSPLSLNDSDEQDFVSWTSSDEFLQNSKQLSFYN